MSDAHAHFTEAWRSVATAKIDEFEYQCERLGQLARCYVVDRAEAGAVLTEIAAVHSLGETFGTEFIFTLIADVFERPPAVQAEAGK